MHLNNFNQKHKHHIVLFIILLLITSISGWYALVTAPDAKDKINNEIKTKKINILPAITTTQQTQIETATKTKQLQTTSSSVNNEQTIEKNKNKDNLTANCQQNCLNTKIKIENTTYDLQLTITTTVYNAMRLLQQDSEFSFNGKNYGSLGFFVEEINGIKNNQQNNKYWIYYINGESSKVGVSSYVLKPNDIITWKYENYK